MDTGTVKTFTDAAALLVPALVQHAAADPSQRSPEDEAMIRQLQVAAGAVAHALMKLPRQQPPMPPQPAIQPPSSNVGADSALGLALGPFDSALGFGDPRRLGLATAV